MHSSPRTWGWTLNQAIQGLSGGPRPHARGGGPLLLQRTEPDPELVPTHVGVDRSEGRREG